MGDRSDKQARGVQGSYLRSAVLSCVLCAVIYLAATLYQADWGQRPLDYLYGMYGLKTAAADRAIAAEIRNSSSFPAPTPTTVFAAPRSSNVPA
ncbi:MAG: hypothetical protein HC795_15490, partial [Coleofasciculaceae cyanobacterium RL_1_1]|nr:hypothetical protein [Coleofasciculaceae cyanobacterium RL_1_1]